MIESDLAQRDAGRLARLKAARQACSGMINARQIPLRDVDGTLIWSFNGVPDDKLQQVAAALATLQA